MLRGIAHASLLFAVSHVPGGPRAYHALTRGVFRSQGRVLRKLQRVWPGYARVWRERCGVGDLEGRTIWVHEPGWVPFAPVASYLLTGGGGVVTSSGAGPSNRYAPAAVRAVLDAPFDAVGPHAGARRTRLAALAAAAPAADELLAATGTTAACGVDPTRLPLASATADVCHSGGALEHLAPPALAAFIRESFRVLRPGGIASHVYDHRDHLRHVDPRWPFLLHMALPDAAYHALFGHRLLFHNRLPPADVMRLFEAAGFEPIAMRRFVLPDKRYVDTNARDSGCGGVPAWLSTGRLPRLTLEDRHTAAIHYLYRKPVGSCARR